MQLKLVMYEFQHRKQACLNTTQTRLAAWAKNALRLSTIPIQSTMSRLLKDNVTYKDLFVLYDLKAQLKRAHAAPRLETALYKGICA